MVALAKLLLDPHYRTIEGFIQLIELEWVQFGHKFADRCSALNGDVNERSPVFLQWLDATRQIVEQFPDAFEFNCIFLEKLAQHVYSSLFGTFISNSLQEMEQSGVRCLKCLSSVIALLCADRHKDSVRVGVAARRQRNDNKFHLQAHQQCSLAEDEQQSHHTVASGLL